MTINMSPGALAILNNPDFHEADRGEEEIFIIGGERAAIKKFKDNRFLSVGLNPCQNFRKVEINMPPEILDLAAEEFLKFHEDENAVSPEAAIVDEDTYCPCHNCADVEEDGSIACESCPIRAGETVVDNAKKAFIHPTQPSIPRVTITLDERGPIAVDDFFQPEQFRWGSPYAADSWETYFLREEEEAEEVVDDSDLPGFEKMKAHLVNQCFPLVRSKFVCGYREAGRINGDSHGHRGRQKYKKKGRSRRRTNEQFFLRHADLVEVYAEFFGQAHEEVLSEEVETPEAYAFPIISVNCPRCDLRSHTDRCWECPTYCSETGRTLIADGLWQSQLLWEHDDDKDWFGDDDIFIVGGDLDFDDSFEDFVYESEEVCDFCCGMGLTDSICCPDCPRSTI